MRWLFYFLAGIMSISLLCMLAVAIRLTLKVWGL